MRVRHFCAAVESRSPLPFPCRSSDPDRALSALSRAHGIPPCDSIFSLLQLCHQQRSPSHIYRAQLLMAFHGLDTSNFLADYLVSTLASCGAVQKAAQCFCRLTHGSVYSWSALISAHVDLCRYKDAIHSFESMLETGVDPNAYTFVGLFKACSGLLNLQAGMRLHDNAHRRGLTSDDFVVSAIINMYGKCECIPEAEYMFYRSIYVKDSVVWNALLSAYVEQCETEKALHMYRQMQETHVYVSMQTYLIMLRSCCAAADKEEGTVRGGQLIKLVSLQTGRALHLEAEKKGFTSDLFLHSALISMYGKCRSTREAEKVFSMLLYHDVVSESAMLSAHLEQGQADNVLRLYSKMQNVDEQILIVGLQALCILAEREEPNGGSWKLGCLEIGRTLDANGRKRGFLKDIFLGSVLVNMYGKCGSINEAENVFVRFTEKDVVLVNALLTVYVEQGQGVRALQFYRQMQEEGIIPHQRTFVAVLQACALIAGQEVEIVAEISVTKEMALEIVQAVHTDARSRCFDADMYVCNTLISTYGKCQNIAEAENVFAAIPRLDIVSWNAMFSAYMEQEYGELALQLYKQMCDKGATPDDTTLSYLLHACRVTGTIKLSRCIHHTIIFCAYDGLPPLASMLIRTYTSCESMIDAQVIFDALDEPDVVSWTSLIAGYAKVGDFLASISKFKQMEFAGVRANGVAYLSILWACSHANLVEAGIDYFQSMRDDGICPDIEHYNCMIDLLGRAGDFTRVKDILSMMHMEPDLITWLCLLNACSKHGNVELGKHCFRNAAQLHPNHAALYTLMSIMYKNAGLLDSAREVDVLWQKQTSLTQSCIGVEKETHLFLVEDQSHKLFKHLDHLLLQTTANSKKGLYSSHRLL